MRIVIQCGWCGQKYSIVERAVGHNVPCKSCGEPIAVPKADDGQSLERDTDSREMVNSHAGN